MRIAVDISCLRTGKSGIQIYLNKTLAELQALDNKNDYFLFTPISTDFIVKNPRWKIIATRMPEFPGSGIIWFQCIFPWLLKKNKIDCLWAPEYFCPVFISRNIRVVLTVHDCTYHNFPETMDKSTAWKFKWFFKRSIKKADAIVTVSEYVRREFLSRNPKKFDKSVISVPNGKPSWEITLGYNADNRSGFLFFAGNFEPRKNLANLVRALEQLDSEGKRIPLHIAGPSGWANDSIHAYISNSRIKDLITCLGYITEEQLIEQYSTCKALVFPSLYEGFGMPVIEALCMDCLVLTSKNTVMQELCGPAALYFDPNDPRDIAVTIDTIYRKDFDRNEYLRYKNDVLKTCSWESTARVVLNALISSGI